MSHETPGIDDFLVVGSTTGSGPPSAPSVKEHPDLETWIAYHEGRLEEARSQELQDHLLDCRKCIDLLLDLDAFNEAESTPQAPAPASFEKEVLWRSVQGALEPEPEVKPVPAVPPASGWQMPFALAAALVVAVLGLSTLGLLQRNELGLLRQQIAQQRLAPNMAIHDLLPGTHRSRSSGVTFEVPPEASHFTLILNLDRQAEAGEYRVVFLGPEGDATLQVGGLKPIDATLTLGLSRQLLPAGEYTVELFDATQGSEQDRVEPAETYRLVLVYL